MSHSISIVCCFPCVCSIFPSPLLPAEPAFSFALPEDKDTTSTKPDTAELEQQSEQQSEQPTTDPQLEQESEQTHQLQQKQSEQQEPHEHPEPEQPAEQPTTEKEDPTQGISCKHTRTHNIQHTHTHVTYTRIFLTCSRSQLNSFQSYNLNTLINQLRYKSIRLSMSAYCRVDQTQPAQLCWSCGNFSGTRSCVVSPSLWALCCSPLQVLMEAVKEWKHFSAERAVVEKLLEGVALMKALTEWKDFKKQGQGATKRSDMDDDDEDDETQFLAGARKYRTQLVFFHIYSCFHHVSCELGM